jgi:hypothetical protein
VWTPANEDTKLQPDSQDVFRDINAARYATYPLEPALRSILALEPEFDLQGVDVIGCQSTIGNLLRYAGLPSQSKAFRFDVDCVGDTVFFTRRESSPTETIQDLRGYGHTFPERYTSWDADVRQSCSHQRIIQYEFGGLQFLLRSETDAYLKATSAGKALTSSESHSTILDTLDSMSVSLKTPSSDQKLVLKMQGNKIPQSTIFDIKTRSDQNVFDMNDIIPRLWLNQTPNFLIAYHHYGLFTPPSVKDVRQDVLVWEKDNSALLGRFLAVIRRILDVVRESSNQQVEVSWDGHGPLRITEQVGGVRRALPSDMHDRWL